MGLFKIKVAMVMLMMVFAGCSSDETKPTEAVSADGSPLSPGDELGAGLDRGNHLATGDSLVDSDSKTEDNSYRQDSEPGSQQGHEHSGLNAEQMKVTASVLNVRRGPGNKFPVVKTLKKGSLVKVIEKKGRWIKINEQEYVATRFLSQP